MNKERLLQLADHLEKPHVAKHFNMNYSFAHLGSHSISYDQPAKDFIEDCGSVACIGGWAFVLFAPDTISDYISAGAAGELLDITYEEANALFYYNTDSHTTPKQAASVVRVFVETESVEEVHRAWNAIDKSIAEEDEQIAEE